MLIPPQREAATQPTFPNDRTWRTPTAFSVLSEIREELFASGIAAWARRNGAPQSGRRAGRFPNAGEPIAGAWLVV